MSAGSASSRLRASAASAGSVNFISTTWRIMGRNPRCPYSRRVSLYADVFGALDRADVRYVVVGGVAVVLSGHARLTVDLDLVLDLGQDNALRAVDALLGCGLQPRLPVDAHQFADAAIR